LKTTGLILLILLLVAMFCFIAGFIAAVGLGIGFLITLGTSSIAFGHAFIAGSIVAAATTFIFLELLRAIHRKMSYEGYESVGYEDNDDEDDDDDDDDEEFPDEDPVLVVPKGFIKRLPGKPGSRKNKK
jgi:hypothetical protein